MPTTVREDIHTPLLYADFFGERPSPKEFTEQLGETSLSQWSEILPEIHVATKKLASGVNPTDLAAQDSKSALAIAVLGYTLDSVARDDAFAALEVIYNRLEHASVDTEDPNFKPGFTCDDFDF